MCGMGGGDGRGSGLGLLLGYLTITGQNCHLNPSAVQVRKQLKCMVYVYSELNNVYKIAIVLSLLQKRQVPKAHWSDDKVYVS